MSNPVVSLRGGGSWVSKIRTCSHLPAIKVFFFLFTWQTQKRWRETSKIIKICLLELLHIDLRHWLQGSSTQNPMECSNHRSENPVSVPCSIFPITVDSIPFFSLFFRFSFPREENVLNSLITESLLKRHHVSAYLNFLPLAVILLYHSSFTLS